MYIHSSLRAWKNHLRGVHEDYRLDVYQTLSLLERERNLVTFNDRLLKFNEFWKDKAPTFTEYFQEYYANRPGR